METICPQCEVAYRLDKVHANTWVEWFHDTPVRDANVVISGSLFCAACLAHERISTFAAAEQARRRMVLSKDL